MQRWEDVEQYLQDEAARDLRAGEPARPCLAAFRGTEPLLLAFLRPHAKGAYADPMIELLTIAGGLRADRVMASFSGRAWSFNDPIPPVLPGVGDLRQRVVTIHRVDGTGARRDELVAEDGDIAEQVLRCHRLGHLLGLSAAVSRRLGFAATTVER